MAKCREDRPREVGGPAELVAILVACRKAGDQRMARYVKDELRRRFGVSVVFHKNHSPAGA